MGETTVPIDSLRAAGFGAEVEAVGTAVADYLDDGAGGNVAIVSEPGAGRDSLLAYAESLLEGDARLVRLDSSASEDGGPTVPDDGALLVADCQYLFERRVDGFDELRSFLDRLALSDTLVVTAWNSYAWSYLDAVSDVSDSFSAIVEIPPLDAEEIRSVVTDHVGADLPAFVDSGHAGRVKTIVFDRQELSIPGDRTIDLPYPKPNPAWVASWSIDDRTESIEAVVFEKIRRVSNGNPGVALAVWERSVSDGEIAPGYVSAPDVDLALDDAEAVLLWTVLVMESAPIAMLERVLADQAVETNLQLLVDRGLVTVENGTAAIVHESLSLAIAALERRQLLW